MWQLFPYGPLINLPGKKLCFRLILGELFRLWIKSHAKKTGNICYLHFGKASVTLPKVILVDKLGKEHVMDANTTGFVLQTTSRFGIAPN